MEAAANADVVFTDVWASMGQEGEAEARRTAFKGFQVNQELLKVCKSDVMVQHCLPAHREEEMTEKFLKPMPRKFLMKLKTASMPRKQLW